MPSLGFITSSLREQVVFRGLADAQLARIAGLGAESRIPAGRILYRQGDAPAGFYVVASGTVRLLVDARPDGSGGREASRCTRGSCFGEMDVLEDSPRSATAQTATAVVLVAFDRRDFEALLGADPEITRAMMDGLRKHIGGVGDDPLATDRDRAS